jgi:hypothetical protein
LKQFGLDAPVNSTGVFLEVVKRKLRILANLDQVAVWIAHVATPFPAMVVDPPTLWNEGGADGRTRQARIKTG